MRLFWRFSNIVFKLPLDVAFLMTFLLSFRATRTNQSFLVPPSALLTMCIHLNPKTKIFWAPPSAWVGAYPMPPHWQLCITVIPAVLPA